jgi:hypothetical protein
MKQIECIYQREKDKYKLYYKYLRPDGQPGYVMHPIMTNLEGNRYNTLVKLGAIFEESPYPGDADLPRFYIYTKAEETAKLILEEIYEPLLVMALLSS